MKNGDFKNKVFVNFGLLEKNNVSSDAVCVYCALRYNMSHNYKEQYIGVNQLGYYLYNRDIKRNEQRLIKNGINNLLKNEIIKEVRKINSNEGIYDLTEVYNIVDQNKFTYINKEDLISIMNINDNCYNKELFVVYLYLIYSMNAKNTNDEYCGKISSINQSTLSDNCGLSINSISKHLDILIKNKLIYSRKAVVNIRGANVIKNFHCRYKDSKLLDKYLENVCKNKKINEKSYASIRIQRSYLLKYEWLLKGKEYDLSEVKLIYNFVSEWNKKKEAEWRNNQTMPKPNLKDLSIFDKYNLN